MFFQNILAIRTAGVKLSNDALNGKESFNQKQFVDSAAKLEELVKAGAFGKNAMSLSNNEAQNEFFLGKAAMRFMGNWEVGNIESEENKVKGKVICKNFPVIENANGDPDGFLGGAVDTFMINSQTKYPDEATKLVKYLSQNLSERSVIDGFGFPALIGEIDKANLSQTSSQISDLLDKSTGYVLAWDTFLEGAAIEDHLDLVAKIFAGEISPEDFAKQMDESVK